MLQRSSREDPVKEVETITRQPGQSLDESTRAQLEPVVGTDLSGVKVHTDAAAAQSARSLGANAYTIGNHIAFDRGKYAPSTQAGQQLLAHELTHVVQQRGSSPSGEIKLGAADHSSEHEAADVASSLGHAGEVARPQQASLAGAVQRDVNTTALEQPPFAAVSVSFNPLVKVFEDGVAYYYHFDGKGGPNWSEEHELHNPNASSIEIHMIMYGYDSNGAGIKYVRTSNFDIKPDGTTTGRSRDLAFPITQPRSSSISYSGNLGTSTLDTYSYTGQLGVTAALQASTTERAGSAHSDTESSGDKRTATGGFAVGGTGTAGVEGTKGPVKLGGGATAGASGGVTWESTKGSDTQDVTSTGQESTIARSGGYVASTVAFTLKWKQRTPPGYTWTIDHFGRGSSTLPPGAYRKLQNWLSTTAPPGRPSLMELLDTGKATVTIRGYADKTGEETSGLNPHVSRHRAYDLRALFVREHWVDSDKQVHAVPLGDGPAQLNGDPKVKNPKDNPAWRKVEIVVNVEGQ